MRIASTAGLFILLLSLSACQKEEVEVTPEPVRGLKTFLISEQENSSARRYPSVLQPSESTSLSFQINGILGENNLDVGQKVKEGDVLVSLDKRSLDLAVESARAALDEAKAAARNAKADLERKEKLRVDGAISQTEIDNVRTTAATSQAKVEQAQSQLDRALEDLSKSDLTAPYDGIINSVAVQSFSTISPGTTIATLYNPSGFEATFSVSYDIANRLVVGKPVQVRLADNPKVVLRGQVTELASSTNTVSSYPVVIALQETHPNLKTGMAVEVSMEFAVTEGEGYPLPISAILVEGSIDIDENFDPLEPVDVAVFVYNEDTQTVSKRVISIAGIRENEVIAVSGVGLGDRIAVAGVSFLREGMKVKLLADNK
ncbi:efflux RND transporter periplasmic adaptor subunit [Alteromonadaceae bacterium M269]|nr:efflux RND transporter periplasmic adaptor subunit [Alteromonadaceae bacterium M269]